MLFVYSVLDRKARDFGPPFLGRTLDFVKRAMRESLAGNNSTTMARYPEDYDVYFIGEFDPDTGVLSPQIPPRLEFCVSELLILKEVVANAAQE